MMSRRSRKDPENWVRSFDAGDCLAKVDKHVVTGKLYYVLNQHGGVCFGHEYEFSIFYIRIRHYQQFAPRDAEDYKRLSPDDFRAVAFPLTTWVRKAAGYLDQLEKQKVPYDEPDQCRLYTLPTGAYIATRKREGEELETSYFDSHTIEMVYEPEPWELEGAEEHYIPSEEYEKLKSFFKGIITMFMLRWHSHVRKKRSRRKTRKQ